MSKSNNIVKWSDGNNIVDSGISITSIGSGSGDYKFRAYMSTFFDPTGGNYSDVAFNSISYDPASGFNTGTYSYTCKKAGYYLIGNCLTANISGSAIRFFNRILKNGGNAAGNNTGEECLSHITTNQYGNTYSIMVQDIVYLALNDVIKTNVYQSTSQRIQAEGTRFYGYLLA